MSTGGGHVWLWPIGLRGRLHLLLPAGSDPDNRCPQVVDMFGCGLPVLTAAYPCISELVRHDVNGLHFSTPAQLAEQLESVFQGFPSQSGRLEEMQVSKPPRPLGSVVLYWWS